MILSRNELLQAESKGFLKINGRNNFDDFTFDLRIKELFEIKNDEIYKDFQEANIKDLDVLQDMTAEEFMKNYLKPVDFKRGVARLEKQKTYAYTTLESISKHPTLKVDVFSKSTYARSSLYSTCHDEALKFSTKKTVNHTCLVNLYPLGADVLIKEQEAIAHAIVKENLNYFVLRDEILERVDRKDLVISIDGKALSSKDVEKRFHHIRKNGIILTKDENILVYNDKVLTPRDIKQDDFKSEVIPEKGFFMPKNKFYLSSSKEHVEIPTDWIGQVYYNGNPNKPYIAHPNAPLIGPKSIYKGKITFENIHPNNTFIKKGEMQSILSFEK